MRSAILAAALVLPALAAGAQQPQRRPTAPPAPERPVLLACPGTIEVDPGDRVRPPQGWATYTLIQHHALRGAALFEGDPAERVELVPSEDRRARRTWWDLGGNRQPYRLVCLYEGIESGIVAEVPAGASSCEITSYREDRFLPRHGRIVDGPEHTRIVCR